MALVDHGIKTEGAASLFGALRWGLGRAAEEAGTSKGLQGVPVEATGTVDWFVEGLWSSEGEPRRDVWHRGHTVPVTVEIVFDSAGTSDGNGDDEMTRLEAAAEYGDRRELVLAAGEMNWSGLRAEDHVRGIRLALAAGAHLIAREIAVEGHERHPDHPALERMACILAPPRASRAGRPADPTVRANRDWFEKHGAEYRGQWVAVREGRLLGHAPSFARLKEVVSDWRKATVTPVAW
jgi:hypothetical protein